MNGRPFDWTDFLGQHRTIAIHTPILVWTGDYHAAALFEELVWRWNTNDREAFTVTDAELMAKLYMTRGALRGARARLVELGAVGTVKRGIPPVLHYTVDPYAMNAPVEPTLVQFQPNDDAILAQPRVEIEPTYIQNGTELGQSNTYAPQGGAGGAPNKPECATAPVDVTIGSPWSDLAQTIALDITGSEDRAYQTTGKRAGRMQAWVGHIVGDVGKAVESDPGGALDLWIMFRGSIKPAEWEQYVTRSNVRERFGKWTQNGGAASVSAVLADVHAGRSDTPVTPGGGA